MDTGYITAVTLNEFIVWFSTGELRIHRRRILSVPLENNGIPSMDKSLIKQLIDIIPHVDLEDEHNVLIITLCKYPTINNNMIGSFNNLLAFDMAYISAESILTIQPLTHRGLDIVKARLYDLHLNLELPMFEKEINELWNEWSVRHSLRGAEAMLELAVREPTFKPSLALIEQAEKAISLIDEQQKASSSDSFIVNIICYNRHDNVPEQDVGFLIDIGIILSQFEKSSPNIQPVVGSLRQLCKVLGKGKDNRKLAELLTDSDIQTVLNDFLNVYESDIDLVSAALFLKWKYLLQRNQRIEIKSVLKDVQDCSGRIAKLKVEKALWLLGLYCGFDRIALDYYMRADYGRYRFVEKRVTNEPVELSKDIVELTPQVKVSEEVCKSNKINNNIETQNDRISSDSDLNKAEKNNLKYKEQLSIGEYQPEIDYKNNKD